MNIAFALPSLVAALAIGCPPPSALAQVSAPAGGDVPSPVAVIVKVPKPWYAPKSVVVGRMRETIPQYVALPGLSFKAFSLARADAQYGGIYLWKDAAPAKAWFSPAWFERVEKERGARADVRTFDVPLVLDNTPGGTPADADSGSVATLVTIAVPPGVGRARLVAEFTASVPTYRAIPGLLRKYYVITGDGRFGGIYLWQDPASAERWFDAAWSERVKKTYGEAAMLEWFDTPILLPSRDAANRIAVVGP